MTVSCYSIVFSLSFTSCLCSDSISHTFIVSIFLFHSLSSFSMTFLLLLSTPFHHLHILISLAFHPPHSSNYRILQPFLPLPLPQLPPLPLLIHSFTTIFAPSTPFHPSLNSFLASHPLFPPSLTPILPSWHVSCFLYSPILPLTWSHIPSHHPSFSFPPSLLVLFLSLPYFPSPTVSFSHTFISFPSSHYLTLPLIPSLFSPLISYLPITLPSSPSLISSSLPINPPQTTLLTLYSLYFLPSFPSPTMRSTLNPLIPSLSLPPSSHVHLFTAISLTSDPFPSFSLPPPLTLNPPLTITSLTSYSPYFPLPPFLPSPHITLRPQGVRLSPRPFPSVLPNPKVV